MAIVGLVHNHVAGLLPQLAKHPDVELVGVQEADRALAASYQNRFHLRAELFYTQVERMIEQTHPDVLLVYTAISDHRRVIEVAARHGVNVMVEKPLTLSLDDALAIRKVAAQHSIHVLVNYETTWYASNHAALQEVKEGRLGEVRKVIVRDGHAGPKAIGVGPEFFNWLTDPDKNGAGALYDFGCYGVDLMTTLMHGETPVSVTAVTQNDQKSAYPRVDDDSTIILRYRGAQAVVLGSWDWTFSIKDMEVDGTTGTAFTVGPNQLRVRHAGEKEAALVTAPPLSAPQDNSIDYLVGVMRGGLSSKGDLSALDTNVLVMQILDAARTSAKEGRTVELKPLGD